MKEDIIIIVAILLFFVTILYFANSYYNTYEGIESRISTTVSPTPTKSVTTQQLPDSFAKSVREESDKLLNSLNISTNKAVYEDIIINMSDYYDNLILQTIVNGQKSDNSDYNVANIIKYKAIKDALQDSMEYLEQA